jgi:hypothetical protein
MIIPHSQPWQLHTKWIACLQFVYIYSDMCPAKMEGGYSLLHPRLELLRWRAFLGFVLTEPYISPDPFARNPFKLVLAYLLSCASRPWSLVYLRTLKWHLSTCILTCASRPWSTCAHWSDILVLAYWRAQVDHGLLVHQKVHLFCTLPLKVRFHPGQLWLTLP